MDINEREVVYLMQKNIKIGADFIRFQYYPHLLVTFIFCMFSGQFVSFQNLSAVQSAKVLEMYVGFVGVLLLIPLFMGEQDKEIWQLEQSKKTPMWQIYLIRLLLAVVSIITIVTVFLCILDTSNSEVYFKDMWCGGISEILFLGSIGFFASAITNQVVLGYMAAVMYYAVNIGGKNIFGKLALFQMSKEKYGFVGCMMLAALFLIVTGMVIRELKN